MNDYDIDMALQRAKPGSFQQRAAFFLKEFKEEVDAHSDGWAYWPAPVRAARLMMEIAAERLASSNFNSPAQQEAQWNKAVGQIRSFYTRVGYKANMKMPASIRRW
jgi:hypothetical protein